MVEEEKKVEDKQTVISVKVKTATLLKNKIFRERIADKIKSPIEPSTYDETIRLLVSLARVEFEDLALVETEEITDEIKEV